MSVTMPNIYTAISDLQADPPQLLKDGRGQYGSYLTLGALMDAVVPSLHELGVTVVQAPTVLDGLPALITRLTHTPSDTFVEATMLLMSETLTPQKQGGAITYARRYALCSMLGLVADEDDDGAEAQSLVKPTRKVTKRPEEEPVYGSPTAKPF